MEGTENPIVLPLRDYNSELVKLILLFIVVNEYNFYFATAQQGVVLGIEVQTPQCHKLIFNKT